MKSYPPFDRPLCEVLAGGVWWPATLDTWEQRADGWWAFVWWTVREVEDVPRRGPMEVPQRYVQWVPAARVRQGRQTTESAPHPEEG